MIFKRILPAVTVLSLGISLSAGTLDDKGFIREWTISGPWPSYPQEDGSDAGLDYDPVGESGLQPFPGKKETSVFVADAAKLIAEIGAKNTWGFTETKKFSADWQEMKNTPQIVSLNKKFDPIDDHFFAYAACYIYSPKTQNILIRAGSDDDHKIYLNGKMIGRQPTTQGVLPGQFRWPGKLYRGINLLVFKIVDRTAGCAFCVQLKDTKGLPLTGITTSTDHPGRSAGARLWDNGFGATLDYGKGILMAGKRNIEVHFFAKDQETYDLELNGQKWSAKGNSDHTLEYPFRKGEQRLTLKVFRDGKLEAELTDVKTAYDPSAIRQENHELQEKTCACQAEYPRLEKQKEQLNKKLADGKKQLAALYKMLEQRYAELHQAAVQDAPKSLDLPVPKVKSPRKKLCINGFWDGSANGGKIKGKFRIPDNLKNPFFQLWSEPIRLKDPKKRFGETEPAVGYTKEDVNYLAYVQQLNLRTVFPGDFDGQTATLVLESMRGQAAPVLNGKKLPVYTNNIGILEIPLVLKKGDNVLELKLSQPKTLLMPRTGWGLNGDVFIDYHSPVRVSDHWIRTSWRKGTISVDTELENRSGKEFTGKLVQYVAERDRIRLKLPDQQVKIGNETVTVKTSSRWADPKLWNIGTPNLYNLVSELYDGEKLVDRKVQEFGFREYWICGTNFYVNGKRTFLYGDTGGFQVNIPVKRELGWNLLRKDGINLIRTHDNTWWYRGGITAADHCGMFMHIQMYPRLYIPGAKVSKKGKNRFLMPLEEYRKTQFYQMSLQEYRNWHKMFRNHPSVFFWSTDNEVGTQSKSIASFVEQAIRDEKIAASYGEYLKSLDPDLILTRDGDFGTWSSRAPWFQNPPCETANYHYPDYDISNQVLNWQEVYDYRPAVFGETLYCHYQTFYDNIGAIPNQVKKTAKDVGAKVKLYVDLEIPAPVFMGPASDCFTVYDDTGKGNPWSIRSSSYENTKNQVLPETGTGRFMRINWPSGSGIGVHPRFHRLNLKFRGFETVNWFDPKYPSHVRNEINDAYGKNLPEQPPLVRQEGTCLVKSRPDSAVWCITPSGEWTGVKADAEGWAWFHLSHAGKYCFTDGKTERIFDVPAKNFDIPGFDTIKRFTLE